MTRLYAILAVVGWAWFVVVAVFLMVKLLRERRTRRAAPGFDVVAPQTSTDAAGNPEREA